MSTHLCDKQISQLLRGTLPDDELVQADAHLWECPDCRDALGRRTEPAPDVPPLAAPRSEGAAPQSALPAVPGYEVLGELNVRPAVNYLALVRNHPAEGKGE